MNVRSVRQVAVSVAALLVVGLVSGMPALAQEGAVTGTVTQAANQQPLEAAQVVVVGTGLGTITDAEGNYRITGVPAGEQRVRVQLVGYASATKSVSVEAGQATTVDFELSQSAVELEQIVVTGTGSSGLERKRLGNTIGTLNTSELENTPTLNMSEVMSGREAGMQVLPASGLSGEGQRIRIRGNASLTQSNEPIIYVDGVRMTDGGQFAGGVSPGTTPGVGASARLDDLDPASIERVEILKGAAAATLYGTEASNGVIQIFTKSGREGSAQWSVQAEQGAEFMPTDRILPLADFPRTSEQAQQMNEHWGANLQPYDVLERPVLEQFDETGRTSTVSASVNGGAEGITYFLSGRYQNLDGIMGLEEVGPATDQSDRATATANVNVYPSDDFRLQLRTNYALTEQSAPNTANNIFGTWSLGLMSQLRQGAGDNEFGSPIFATVRESMQRTTSQDVDHFGGSLNTDLRPSDEVTLNATFGIDITNNRSEETTPFKWNVDQFSPFFTQGFRTVGDHSHTELTLELRGGWEREFGDFSSSLTVGTQNFMTEEVDRGGTGFNFPGPGLDVASAAADQSISESWVRNVNVGVFAQEQIGFREFAYLTLGSRLDANSAFGEEFNVVNYPKANFSIIPSDLEGWNSETFSTFRIRGAVGRSGLQPGAFDKFRTFSPLPSVAGPGVQPDNLGNPELKPEVTTEWEAGIELGLAQDRYGLEATFWDRTVDDALVSRQFPVSGGFSQTQLDNIGELTGQGLDLSANGTVLQAEDISISLHANASYLTEEVTDMGGAPPIKAGGSYPRYRNFIREGHTPGAFFGAKTADLEFPINYDGTCDPPSRDELLTYFSQPRTPDDFEVISAGQVNEGCDGDFLDNFLGKPTPDWQGSFGADVSFLERFQASGLFQFKTGNFRTMDLSGAFRQSNSIIGRNTPKAAEVNSTLQDPSSTAEDRLDAALTWANELRALAPMSGMNSIHPSDFLRWREFSLTYDTPSSFARTLSLRTLSVSLRARNIKLWVNDDYTGMDPELDLNGRCQGGGRDCNWLMGIEGWRMPLPRRLIVAVRAGF